MTARESMRVRSLASAMSGALCIAALGGCGATDPVEDDAVERGDLVADRTPDDGAARGDGEIVEDGLVWDGRIWSVAGAMIPDFSYAGYGFGTRAVPDFAGATVVDATSHGVVADDGKDDSAGLLAALDAARAVDGPVVLQLPSGRVRLSAILPIDRSGLVLRGRGHGEGGTEIHIPRPLSLIDTGGKFDEITEYLDRFDKVQREPDQNVEWPFSPYSWTGGFLWVGPEGYRAAAYLEERDRPDEVLAEAVSGERGGLRLAVASTDGLREGDDVELVWYSRDGEGGGVIREIYGDTDLDVGSHHWTFPERGLVRQKTVIASVEDGAVTLMDPLLHSVSDAAPASLVAWSPLVDVGIEDLAITFPEGVSFGHHLEQGFNGIYFTGVRDGWIRDVRIRDADSGVLTYSSANVTIDNVTTEGERTAHYSVHAGNVHNVLVSDLEVRNPVRHSLSLNTQSTKTVYQRARVHRDAVLDQHAGSNHQNLFDQTLVHIDAVEDEGGRAYAIWDGSGAGYWQPGHGRFNTTYNMEVRVRTGADRDETVVLQGLAEGPDARLVGIWGNRDFEIDYRPHPVIADLNTEPTPRSLYDAQLARRMEEAGGTTR